jgi:O-acetyl-ADP-ribose deacetylase (regulator of RNase III)
MIVKKSSIVLENKGIIVHGVNCQGVMGSGVAMQFRNKFPVVYTDYVSYFNQHKYKREKLLGNIVVSKINEDHYIVSAFTQLHYGRDPNVQYVDYGALKSCFEKINDLYLETALPIKFPKIGAGLANGNWDIIEKIINDTLLEEIEKELFIYG